MSDDSYFEADIWQQVTSDIVNAKPAPGRRPRRSTAAKSIDADQPANTAPQAPAAFDAAMATAAETPAAAAPKRRGRPPKNPVASLEPAASADGMLALTVGAEAAQAPGAIGVAGAIEPAPKRRGRPPKNPQPIISAPIAADAAPERTRPIQQRFNGGDDRASGRSRNSYGDSQSYYNGRQGSDSQSYSAGRQGNGRQGGYQQNQQNAQNARRQRRANNYTREIVPSTTREDLEVLKVSELRERAASIDLDVSGIKKKDELIDAVLAGIVKSEGFIDCEGVLDLLSEGYGFLRTSGYLPGEADVYVGMAMVRRNNLRKGDFVKGQVRPARENEKFAALHRIDQVNGMPPEASASRPRFADLTPVYPDERLLMEHGRETITARTIDLVAPIGKGQRGLIVSPPKAGKTTILKDIAAAISANDPQVHLMCLLVDERPEEVTDMERSIKGEVVSSTFDMPSENHIAVAELVIERAKRLVESGMDVVILLDSITRLARAYNLAQPASGRILSGGVDSTALYPPKRFLGAARNIEGGGSLTILASALIDTGSKMDEVIFEEFKGTGNMELRLDRDLSDRRVFPAIDPVSSGTRKEELLLDQQEAPLIWAVRRILANMNNTERAMEMLIKSLKQTNNNTEFLIRTAKKAQQRSTSESVEL
jgi:transcription termination factor Rho